MMIDLRNSKSHTTEIFHSIDFYHSKIIINHIDFIEEEVYGYKVIR